MINEQRLRFEENHKIAASPESDFVNTETFSHKGFAEFHHIKDIAAAQALCTSFVAALDLKRIPHFASFEGRIKLGKADRIPSRHCQDAVKINNVSLHFDMGLPLIPAADQENLYLLTCLYFPYDSPLSSTKTRLFDTRGIFSAIKAPELEERLIHYAQHHGTGYGDFIFGRLSCLGQLLEAALGGKDLAYMKEHRIADWFNRGPQGEREDGLSKEEAFFLKFGLNLADLERLIHLRPGDLLIIDNLRLAHGRRGSRQQEELWQILFGVDQVLPSEIHRLRRGLVDNLCAQS